MLESNQWYTRVLLNAVTGKYSNASIFFDELKNSEPAGEILPSFDEAELDLYRHPINHSRKYREDGDFIIENADKEVYISDGKLIKAWLNIADQSKSATENFQVLNFLKRIDKLNSIKPTYLPVIRDYGIASKSSSLFLVTDRVEGCTWDKLELSDQEKFEVIAKLVAAVEHLHGLGLAHGDIHPYNVMLDTETKELYLIDIPDFSLSTNEPKNHRYSPEKIDGCTIFERDNFAVMRMSSELLGFVWGGESEQYPQLEYAVKAELEDFHFGFKDLGRFKKALSQCVKTTEKDFVEIIAGNAVEPITILPDNGHLYVKVEQNHNKPTEVKVSFTGIGGTFSAIYSKTQQLFVIGFNPRERSSVSKWDEDESNFEISTPIRIIPGYPSEMTTLSSLLKDNEAFSRAIDLIADIENKEEQNTITQELKEAFKCLDNTINEQPIKHSLTIPTTKLWRAILDTETESYPNIEISGDIISSPSGNGEYIIPYSSEIDPLGAFRTGDEVEALLVDADGTERFIGDVSLKNSALNEIRLIRTRGIYKLKDGDNLFFRSKQDRASYRKRKAALKKLLDREGILPNLVDIFDPTCENQATDYGISLTDDDFERYDREDQHGNKISLNEQQRAAFTKLVNYGPLSLLQGPPGTGKTEFIAAFVHYLIEKQQTKQILLVSQSHEAVNTAAERIRKHCSRLGTELEIVRFSNREGAVSTGLKDVYSHSITAEKRALFEAEFKYRVEALSDALGLEPEFISNLVQAELKLFKQIDHLISLLSPDQSGLGKDEIQEIKKISLELNHTIHSKLLSDYGIKINNYVHLVDIKETVISKLCRDYNVRPDEAKKARALAKVSRDMLDVWASERVNCDEFYARSRQLITGTCVGIGQGHIGIQNNLYDWVIIDEAARSISSELAIAMQSAKRILLVGDHLQLPPLYSDAHKKALARKLGITGAKEELDDILQSDFARAFSSAYGDQTSAALLTQYRMAPPIGDLISEVFYAGKLKNGERAIPDIYQDTPEALRHIVTWLDTSELGVKAYHSDDRGSSIYNRYEADLVIELLKDISKKGDFLSQLSQITGKDEAAIGVICMYAEQKRILRQKFNQEVWSDGFKSLVKIDSVDSYQGKENRIIILSLTRSDKNHSAGFLRTANRINVAISRAMDRLLIIGNTDMWKGRNKDMPLGQVIHYMTEKDRNSGYAFIKAKIGEKNNVR